MLRGKERAEGVKRLIVASLFSSTDQPPCVNDPVFDRRERRIIRRSASYPSNERERDFESLPWNPS